jgi:hypothetical protein
MLVEPVRSASRWTPADPHGGSGSAGAWDTYYWLWPLPPPGRLLIVVEWPAKDTSEAAVEVAADPVLKAAARAVTLWP